MSISRKWVSKWQCVKDIFHHLKCSLDSTQAEIILRELVYPTCRRACWKDGQRYPLDISLFSGQRSFSARKADSVIHLLNNWVLRSMKVNATTPMLPLLDLCRQWIHILHLKQIPKYIILCTQITVNCLSNWVSFLIFIGSILQWSLWGSHFGKRLWSVGWVPGSIQNMFWNGSILFSFHAFEHWGYLQQGLSRRTKQWVSSLKWNVENNAV